VHHISGKKTVAASQIQANTGESKERRKEGVRPASYLKMEGREKKVLWKRGKKGKVDKPNHPHKHSQGVGEGVHLKSTGKETWGNKRKTARDKTKDDIKQLGSLKQHHRGATEILK